MAKYVAIHLPVAIHLSNRFNRSLDIFYSEGSNMSITGRPTSKYTVCTTPFSACVELYVHNDLHSEENGVGSDSRQMPKL